MSGELAATLATRANDDRRHSGSSYDAADAAHEAAVYRLLGRVPGLMAFADHTPPPPTADARLQYIRLLASAARISGTSAFGPAAAQEAEDEAEREARAAAKKASGAGGALDAALAALLRPGSFASSSNKSRVAWSAVAGQREAKAALYRSLVWPARHADAVRAYGLAPPAGVLLFGRELPLNLCTRINMRMPSLLTAAAPGTGKTLLARAAAASLRCAFLPLSIPAVLRAGVGDSERALAAAFGAAEAAAPCLLFIDEVQALFAARGSGDRGGGEEAAMNALLTSQVMLGPCSSG
jgi:SpoVK/Ycf46/Vps4 family AAA+-type ATPase